MSYSMRELAIKSILPAKWKADHQSAAIALKRFSDVEADSAWQYVNAMRYTDDPKISCMLFKNFVEELSHSDSFLKVATSLSTKRFAQLPEGRDPLMSDPADMNTFLAFAHESERSISRQFASYASASPFANVRQVFLEIAEDEAGHEREARHRLDDIVESPRRASWLIFRVKVKRAVQAWERFGHRIGSVISTIVFGGLYLLFGVFFHRHCKSIHAEKGGPRAAAPLPTALEASSRKGAPSVVQ